MLHFPIYPAPAPTPSTCPANPTFTPTVHALGLPPMRSIPHPDHPPFQSSTPLSSPPNKQFSSPTSSLLRSRPPSPIPRDDIIEGMSASTSSIFERDVEHFEPTLSAHEAIQLAVPPVLDQAIEALSTSSPEHILVDLLPLPLHLSGLPNNPFPFPDPSLAPDSPPSPSMPGLHRHCPSDSDPSSPRSLSPSPSLRPQLSSASPHPPHAHPPTRVRKLCLSFMSYVDIINAERAEEQESSLSALARLRLARASTRSLSTTPASFLDPGPARPHPLARLGSPWICPPAPKTLANNPSQGSAKSHATTPAPDEEAEVLSDLEWNSC